MIVRSSSRMARTVLSVGALTLAAVIFGFPVSAKPKTTGYQMCAGQCQLGQQSCFATCRCIWKGDLNACPGATKRAAIARRPITGTGAPSRSTHLHR